MRRRPRLDLGGREPPATQLEITTSKDEAKLERRRKRWAVVNKNRPANENPFLAAIKPDHDNYGDSGENAQDLRARLASLEFGNYPGYFNYRNKATEEPGDQPPPVGGNPLEIGLTDERLRLMKEEWFKGKNVLDVGCNRGHITYAIAKMFAPRFILGIDIDLKMIHMANRDLHMHLEEDLIRSNLEFRIKQTYKLSDIVDDKSNDQTTSGDSSKMDVGDAKNQYTEDDKQHFTLSSYVAQGPLATCIPKSIKTNGDSERESETVHDNVEPCEISTFPNNILFVEHNYVLSKDELVDKQKAYFDTIVCLSVTKWIHLNYRDDGLKRFLKRMYNHLNAGGLLILEVQPFDNYHRKKKLSDRLRSNFNSIKFKPDQFDEFLLSDQVGFKQILFSTTTEHQCAGFKRPMKVFLK